MLPQKTFLINREVSHSMRRLARKTMVRSRLEAIEDRSLVVLK
jgi:hypothetical protein